MSTGDHQVRAPGNFTFNLKCKTGAVSTVQNYDGRDIKLFFHLNKNKYRSYNNGRNDGPACWLQLASVALNRFLRLLSTVDVGKRVPSLR